MTARTEEELDARLERAARRRRAATIERLGLKATLWLAAPPLWTQSAAKDAGFPVGSGTLTDFVERACAAGWCETGDSLSSDGPAELRFWMPDELRGEVLRVVSERISGGLSELQRDVRALAEKLRGQARTARPNLPGALTAWAELCTGPSLDQAPLLLIERVEQAVGQRDLGHAQELVVAGEALEPVVAGTARQAVERAQGMLDLGRQQRTDEGALSRYLDRRELSDAVTGLLREDTRQWALHVRGAGGAGKTMLIRYLTSGRYAAERDIVPIAMASVNFDQVTPDYPSRKPVQLLLELADGLALHAAVSGGAYRDLLNFRQDAELAEQAVSGVPEGDASVLQHPQVRNAVISFARAVGQLGRVLLVLDTCEELAKWDTGNADSQPIRATLQIVDLLHQHAGNVRVLFAGRRALPHRSWLRVENVAGFTREEARDYLTQFGQRRLPDELIAAIIEQSPAVVAPADEPAAGRGRRVNPFDLAMYRAWADEEPEPGLTVEKIEGGNDAYVEARIIDRLDDPLVRRSLPMLAAGGKCRVAAIAAALGSDEPGRLGQLLAAQEWVEAEGGQSPEFVTAWPAMAERLRRFFGAPGRQKEFGSGMRRFAAALLDWLGAAPLADIGIDEVVTALRWAPQPADAAAAWDSIVTRTAGPPGRWDGLSTVTRRILGRWEEDGPWPSTDALRAAVLAAHAAACRRDNPSDEALRELWEQVLASASGHPAPKRQRQLQALGCLGLLPHRVADAALWAALRAEQPSLASSPELGTAAIDAVHRLLEAGHGAGARQLLELLSQPPAGLDSLGQALNAWGADGGPGNGHALRPTAANRALAWARVADARLRADDDPVAARRLLAQAEDLARAATGPEPSWPYWIPPRDLLARIRIERGLIDRELIPAASELTLLEPWEDYAAKRLASADGERLASLCLRLRLQHRAVSIERAQAWELSDRYEPARAATDSAHHLVPPLFVSVAQAWLSAGRPERALAVLERRRSEANAARDDATVRQADAAVADLARRLRLPGFQRALLIRLTDPAEYRSDAGRARLAVLDDARRAWAVIYGGPPAEAEAETGRLAGWHGWWQCQATGLPAREAPSTQVEAAAGSGGREVLADLADIQADLTEMKLLAGAGTRPWPEHFERLSRRLSGLLDAPGQVARRSLRPVRNPDPHHGLRLDVRWSAIGNGYASPLAAPLRLIAEIAFSEAELLALRLPERAARVYRFAAGTYDRCGDHVGRLLALAAFQEVLAGCPGAARSELLALPWGIRTMREAVTEALATLGHQDAELARRLTGPRPDAGLWEYWAGAVHGQARRDSPPGQPEARDAGQPGDSGSLPATVALLPDRFLARAPEGLHVRTQAPPALPDGRAFPLSRAEELRITRSGPPPGWAVTVARAVIGVLATPLAAVLAGGARAAFRLAAERAIGVTRADTFMFRAMIGYEASGPYWVEGTDSGDAGSRAPGVRLFVRPQAWRLARVAGWARLRLRALNLAAGLLRFGFPRRFTGYAGTWALDAREPSPVGEIRWSVRPGTGPGSWWGDPRPGSGAAADDGRRASSRAGRRRRGPVPGSLTAGRHWATEPWERLIASSLGPGAAGRVEWIRYVLPLPPAYPFPAEHSGGEVIAPPEWERLLVGSYNAVSPSARTHAAGDDASPFLPPRVRHVIGRAMPTSAGPCVNVRGARGRSADLLACGDLSRDRPLVVVLQAEPAADNGGDGRPDAAVRPRDRADELLLALALMDDGIPAVLILPPLPSRLLAEIGQLVAVFAGGDGGAGEVRTGLLRPLRAAIAPHVEPETLDEIIVLLNMARSQ